MTRTQRPSVANVARALPKSRALLLLAGLGGGGALTPRAAHAGLAGDYATVASAAARWACRKAGGSRWVCNAVALIADPTAPNVTGFAWTMQYDPARYTFDASRSGPLCQFAVGGDCPPVDPLVGTQPVRLQPPGGYTAGTPLPGSSLSMADAGNQVNVIYSLPGGVAAPADGNFFLMAFDLNEPLEFDELAASVTYGAPGGVAPAEGADFTQTAFFCTTSPPGGFCRSDQPVSTITTSGFTTPTSAPEPSGLVLLTSGGAALVGAASLRRRYAA